MIHETLPDFRMILVGDGPDMDKVRQFCATRNWCVCTGAIHGLDRVPTLSLGDVWLNPGMIGLAILDAFALGIPVATTENGLHSPEIVYLRDGRNGVISSPDPTAFAQAVTELLSNPERLLAMKAAAAETGMTYTLERMVKRFAAGICCCLGIDPVSEEGPGAGN
jgi:glycosyltransferase involved in cell wall biosynthesis